MSDQVIGQSLGPYELLEMVGRGGMGVVYRARQPSTARDVAVKVINASFGHHPDFVRRFEQEAQASASLQHPHILPVYDAGLESGHPYLVMAYLSGGTLAEHIHAQPDGLLLDEVVRITAQLANALDYAHARSVIHCDVKPGNVLLDGLGNVYLADFGIARLVEGAASQPGEGLGTVPYVAPEVASGGSVSTASDIYGLGMVVLEMLAGQLPASGSPEAASAAKLLALLDHRRPELPLGVGVVLGQALNVHPESRPPHARSLAKALALASGHPLPQEPPTLPHRTPTDADDTATGSPRRTPHPGQAAAHQTKPPAADVAQQAPSLAGPPQPVVPRPTRVHQPGAPPEEEKPPRRLMWLVWGGLAFSVLLLIAAVIITLSGFSLF